METNILMWALAGFAAVVVLMQTIPALVMFTGMVKGVLSPSDSAYKTKEI